jgi:hypothetical protein
VHGVEDLGDVVLVEVVRVRGRGVALDVRGVGLGLTFGVRIRVLAVGVLTVGVGLLGVDIGALGGLAPDRAGGLLVSAARREDQRGREQPGRDPATSRKTNVDDAPPSRIGPEGYLPCRAGRGQVGPSPRPFGLSGAWAPRRPGWQSLLLSCSFMPSKRAARRPGGDT